MKTLTNIAASDAKPLYVDPASITAICVYPDNTLLAYNAQGKFLNVDRKNWGVDPNIMIQKLAEAGNALISFPVRYDGKEYAYYVAPSAVTFATVSEADKDGNINAIVGVKGQGRLESYGTKPEEFQSLLNGVTKTGKNLLEYNPSQAHSRFSNAAALYIDPAAIKEIRDDGSQVNVSFEGSGMLDIQTRDSERSSNRVDELLNSFWNKRRTEFKNIDDCGRAARRQVKEEEKKARMDFANGIATANGTLIRIKNDNVAVHITPDEVAYVSFYDDDKQDTGTDKYVMTLERQQTRDEHVNVRFNSAAARTEAFETLCADIRKQETLSSMQRVSSARGR